MKKQYIKPQAEMLDVLHVNILDVSIPVSDGTTGEQNTKGNFYNFGYDED